MAYSQKIALTAIIARLKAVSGVYDLVGGSTDKRIYSDVPQKTTFPYIAVDVSSVPFVTKDTSDQDHEITIHAFSRLNSPSETADILAAVFAALDRQEANVTLGSGNLTLLTFQNVNDIFKEADGITWHGVLNFRMLIT